MTDETQEQQITAVGNEMSASFLAAKKRSDATLAKLEENPGKFTMLTGDRPTGRLHLGHRHRPGKDHDLHAFRGSGREPADAAVPFAGD